MYFCISQNPDRDDIWCDEEAAEFFESSEGGGWLVTLMQDSYGLRNWHRQYPWLYGAIQFGRGGLNPEYQITRLMNFVERARSAGKAMDPTPQTYEAANPETAKALRYSSSLLNIKRFILGDV